MSLNNIFILCDVCKSQHVLCLFEMCSSGKYPYTPHGRSLEIPREWGVSKAKILKQSMGLSWNVQRGGGILFKTPSVGGVWIFYGTTQYTTIQLRKVNIKLLLC